mmetsp:Transcript_34359/g.31069  ORF Transcript_34359/g.31069 Transcript_34359/m.31069 type:complete len:114 (+) Transcript_34359:332-673(+)
MKSIGKFMAQEQSERVATIFQTGLQDNRISIDKITDVLNHILSGNDQKSEQYDIGAVNLEMFKHLIINFEGINMMFSTLSEAKKAYKELDKFLMTKRRQIRGFSLIAAQTTFF